MPIPAPSWINTLKNTEAAFRGTTYSLAEKRSKIQFFAAICVVLGVALGVTGVRAAPSQFCSVAIVTTNFDVSVATKVARIA